MSVVSGRIGELVARLARRHEGHVRESFAFGLERAVDEVDGPLHRATAAVTVDRPAVAEAAPLLLGVAARLRAPEALPVEAMRLVRALVSDGTGPLYAGSAHRSDHPPGTLAAAARAILHACDDARLPTPEPRELVRS
jgi:hypothetical protein